MLPVDDRMIEACRSVLSVLMENFRLLKTIYVHLFVCYLIKLQNAQCNDKDDNKFLVSRNSASILDRSRHYYLLSLVVKLF